MIGHLTRGGLVLAMLGLFMVLPTAMPTAQANPIVADLSKDHISIRSNFVGEQLLLFGALAETPDGPIDDIIVVMRGPDETFTVRKKSKRAGIWVNDAAYAIGPVPGFYALASTGPLADIAPDRALRENGIGEQSLAMEFGRADIPAAERQQAIEGFIRLKQNSALYREQVGAVKIIGERLFRVEINLPSGMPVGDYVTEFFAFQKGRLVGYQTGLLPVDIVGTGHVLHKAAYEMPLVYGTSGVIMAVIMGWGVAVLFRRR